MVSADVTYSSMSTSLFTASTGDTGKDSYRIACWKLLLLIRRFQIVLRKLERQLNIGWCSIIHCLIDCSAGFFWLPILAGNSRHRAVCIKRLRIIKNLRGFTVFDSSPFLHNSDSIAYLHSYSQIMSYENKRTIESFLNIIQ